jgi:hypothetical protein
MLSRFCAAIDITGAAEASDGTGFEGLRFDFFAVALVRIAIPKKMAGQAAWQPDPDAFPVEVCPRSASHHVTGSDLKA